MIAACAVRRHRSAQPGKLQPDRVKLRSLLSSWRVSPRFCISRIRILLSSAAANLKISEKISAAFSLLTIFFAAAILWTPVVQAETVDEPQTASVSDRTCIAPTCAKPPSGCVYVEASACACGVLVCDGASIEGESEQRLTAIAADSDVDSGQTALLAIILSVTAGLLYLARTATHHMLRAPSFDMTRENRRHPTFHD